MELNRNLLYEVIRYHPKLVFIFECLDSETINKLTGDLSYLYFLLEELYSSEDVRGQTLADCKQMLRDVLERSLLVKFSCWCPAPVSYDVITRKVNGFVCSLPDRHFYFREANLVFISVNQIFICGGNNGEP